MDAFAQSVAVVFSAAALAMATASWDNQRRRRRVEEERAKMYREVIGELKRRTWELEMFHQSLRDIDAALHGVKKVPAKCPDPGACRCVRVEV